MACDGIQSYIVELCQDNQCYEPRSSKQTSCAYDDNMQSIALYFLLFLLNQPIKYHGAGGKSQLTLGVKSWLNLLCHPITSTSSFSDSGSELLNVHKQLGLLFFPELLQVRPRFRISSVSGSLEVLPRHLCGVKFWVLTCKRWIFLFWSRFVGDLLPWLGSSIFH